MPASCLAVFRLLPSLAKHVVMSLLYVPGQVSLGGIRDWSAGTRESQRQLGIALIKACKLRVLVITDGKGQDMFTVIGGRSSSSAFAGSLDGLSFWKTTTGGAVSVDETFREHMAAALTGSGDQSSFGAPVEVADKHAVDTDFLNKYSNERWESILHFMVGTRASAAATGMIHNTAGVSGERPGAVVLSLLKAAGLMGSATGSSPSGSTAATPSESGGDQDPDSLRISSLGFQFLLLDRWSQVWALLLQYLWMVEHSRNGMDVVDALHFLFKLGSLQFGSDYATVNNSTTQSKMLGDLRELGLVYQRKKGSRRFYPTRLATMLTSGSSRVANAAATVGQSTDGTAPQKGFIILETNYKLYAFTSSPLHMAILNLFSELTGRFPNMVTAVLTRESIRRALTNGVTARQIVSFLVTYSHPQMHSRSLGASSGGNVVAQPQQSQQQQQGSGGAGGAGGAALSAMMSTRKQPVLPPTVVDQIYLWEIEKDRVGNGRDGVLYKEFVSVGMYDLVFKYAESLSAVLWSSRDKQMMVIAKDCHEQVKTYVSKWRQEQQLKKQRQQMQLQQQSTASARV
ncbi:transcription factor Tfb2 [Ramicandelaber brevisporus]|nr:transcription factor Tfb2 [Ramicandelaber brevisporus]